MANIAKTNQPKQLHITFENSMNSEIGFILYRMGIKSEYEKIVLDYMLSIGDISNPPYSNESAYIRAGVGIAEIKEKSIEKNLSILKSMPDDTDVYLWCSEWDENEVLNLYYFAHLFCRFNNVYLISAKRGSEPSFNDKRKIDIHELDSMSKKMDNILKQEGFYRVCKNGEVVTFEKSVLEYVVLHEMETDYQLFAIIVKRIWDNREKHGFDPSWDTVRAIVFDLSRRGIIESDGVYTLWNGWNGPCALFDKKFRISQSKRENLSLIDALKALRDSIVYGATYLIYNSLAENIVLDCQGNEIIGKDNVISYIEKRGMYHYYIEKEKIKGSKIKINYENEVEDGVLIIYEGGDYKNPFVITVDYDGKQISKIYVEYLYHKKGILNIDLNDD